MPSRSEKTKVGFKKAINWVGSFIFPIVLLSSWHAAFQTCVCRGISLLNSKRNTTELDKGWTRPAIEQALSATESTAWPPRGAVPFESSGPGDWLRNTCAVYSPALGLPAQTVSSSPRGGGGGAAETEWRRQAAAGAHGAVELPPAPERSAPPASFRGACGRGLPWPLASGSRSADRGPRVPGVREPCRAPASGGSRASRPARSRGAIVSRGLHPLYARSSLPGSRRLSRVLRRRPGRLFLLHLLLPVTEPRSQQLVRGGRWRLLSGNKMSVSVHENRKSRASSGSINIYLFHKSSYADSVLTHLNLLRQQRLFTDVLLHAGNRTFPCHRAVLAACSRYFEAMFSGGLKESQDSEVNFDNTIHPEVLELLLDYAYSSRVIINEENAESLLEAGDMLEFQDIRDACAEFLEKNLHPTNCLGMLLLSDAHQCTKLYELSWRMCLSNFQTIRKNEDFLQLPQDMVVQLLSSEELETEDERLVYESAINWISYDLKKRYCYLPELLQTVRLALLPAIYLMENVAMEELITKQRKSKEIVEEAIRCKLKILQNDGVVTSLCARPRKTGHALFLLGGQTFMCDKLYLVDQKAKEIIPKADIPSPRKEFSACAIGCKVYITGGRGSENGVSKDVWVYDTLHEEWSKAAPMLVARFGHGSAELKHCLYVVGGHTAATGCLPASPSVSLKQVEHYDPATNKWTMVAPLREGVSNAAVVSAKLKLFAFGGTSVSHDKLPKVQCYDQCENRWTVPATCPQPWRYTAAAVLGNQIFIMGGDTEFSACSAYKFNSETYQWTKVGDVTAKRMSCHAVASGNKLYVVGGYFGIQRCKTLDCYDPTLDVWNSITTVPYSLIPTAFVSTWKHLPS